MYLLILLFPLMGSLLAGLFGRFLGFKDSRLITITRAGLIISTIFSLIVFFEVALCGSHLTVSLMSHDPHIPGFMTFLMILSLLSFYISLQNASEECQLGFQDPGTSLMPEIWLPDMWGWELELELWNDIFLFIFLLSFLFGILFILIPYYAYCMVRGKRRGPPAFEIKITGREHFWLYQYKTLEGRILAEFESLPRDIWQLNLTEAQLDSILKRLVVPTNVPIKFTITSDDVIHTWTIERLDLSGFAVPGCVFERTTTFVREEVYHGGCFPCSFDPTFTRVSRLPTQERLDRGDIPLRRRHHPIILEVVSLNQYINWIRERMQEQKQHPKGGPKADRPTSPSGASKTPLEP